MPAQHPNSFFNFAILRRLAGFIAALATFLSVAVGAFAQDALDGLERVGKPKDGGIWLQEPVGEQARMTYALNAGLIWLSIAIVVFVCVLLAIVIFRFRDTGKEPKRFSHNTPLEIIWTLVPVLILVVLAVFSVPALQKQLSTPESDVVVKITGYQWYWNYEYPEEGIAFDAYMLARDELAAHGYEDDEYLLATDQAMVVPKGKNVVIQVTGADVIHSWKIPSFAVMVDAMPGRIMQSWFNADKEGVYFGQCSELCGKDHAYMPIVVKVVSEEVYAKWLEGAKEEFATGPVQENATPIGSQIEVATNNSDH